MNIYEKIKAIAKEQGNIKIRDLEQKLDFAENTLSKWSKNIPSIDKVVKVADYFNVSLDYFVNRTVPPPTTSITNANGIVGTNNVMSDSNNFSPNGQPNNLPEIEIELLTICNKLDTRKKTALLTYAYGLEENKN